MILTVQVTAYTPIAYSSSLVSTTHFNSKATPIINTNYSCHTKAVELV